MSTKTAKAQVLPDPATLINTQYGCGPVHFAGTSEALYERHLLFDSGVDLEAATARDRLEARRPRRRRVPRYRRGSLARGRPVSHESTESASRHSDPRFCFEKAPHPSVSRRTPSPPRGRGKSFSWFQGGAARHEDCFEKAPHPARPGC
jgi:hypothetical protein